MNPASERMLIHFSADHLPPVLREVSVPSGVLARAMATDLDSDDPSAGAEVTTGLRKLLEATDCFVRARVILERRAAQTAIT